MSAFAVVLVGFCISTIMIPLGILFARIMWVIFEEVLKWIGGKND